MDESGTGSQPGRIACTAVGLLGLVVLIASAGALVAPPASAQYSMLGDIPPRFEWRSRVETHFRNEFASRSDGGDEFDAWRVGVVGEIGGPINESILIGFRAGYRHTSYEFNLENAPPPAYGTTTLPHDPWNPLNTVDLLPSTTVLVGSRVSVVAAVPIRWAGEAGARRNGFTAGISGLVRWQVNDALSIGAGIGVTSQLEDDAETFPVISLRWRISENFEFATEGSWLQGGNAILFWGSNDAIRLSLSAGYERIRYRLDDHGTLPDRDGIGEVTTVPIEVGLRLQIFEEAFLDVRAGLGVAGRLRIETDNGRKLYDRQYDPAPRLGVSLTIPFGLPDARSTSDR